MSSYRSSTLRSLTWWSVAGDWWLVAESTQGQKTVPTRGARVTRSAEYLLTLVGRDFHLPEDHAVVAAALAHELLVRAALDDAAVLHDENEIGTADRRQSMSNDERRAPGEQRGHRQPG